MDAVSGVNAYTQGIELGFDTSTSSEGRQNSALDGRVSSIKPVQENTDSTGLNLTLEEKDKIREMRLRDREVRMHEQAHMAAGVSASGPTYTCRKGPDGKMYAVAGEVQIDTSPEKDPEDTIAKARQIKAAANAPAEPSAQDKAVAAQAAQMEADAQKELQAERAEEQGATNQPGPSPAASGTAQDASSPDTPWTLQNLSSQPAYYAAQAQALPQLQSIEAARHDAHVSRDPDQAGMNVDTDRAIQSRSASIRALASGHFFLNRPQDALLASPSLNEGIPSVTAAPRSGWAQSGDASSFAGDETHNAHSRPADLQRAALVYQSSLPSTGLAPQGTGISLAV